MFTIFGGGYHVFMVANRIGCFYSYMLPYENLHLWGSGYLRVEDIVDGSGICPSFIEVLQKL